MVLRSFKLILFVLLIAFEGVASEPLSQCRDVFLEREPFFGALARIQQPPGQLMLGGFGSSPVRNPGKPSYRYTVGWDAPYMLQDRRPKNGAEQTMTSIDVQAFYGLVYGQYLNRYDDGLIKIALDTDKSLEMDRLIYFQIFSWDKVEGTFRIFIAHANGHDHPDDTFASPPFERLNAARGVGLRPISQILRDHAKQGHGIYEIGKFWVRHESDRNVRDRTAELIELYWAAQAKEDDIYIAHVMSKAHIRLYKKYGFKVVDEYAVRGPDGKESTEFILTVTGRDFRANLEELLRVDLERLF